ncbi:MAG: hypothetical protein ACTSUN_04130 [Promethearchaeota archaeon]
MKGIGNPFVITCPACGFSFQKVDPKSGKRVKACPMCGYKLIEFDDNLNRKDDYKRPLI